MEGVRLPKRGQVQVPHGRVRIQDLRRRGRGCILGSRQHRGEAAARKTILKFKLIFLLHNFGPYSKIEGPK